MHTKKKKRLFCIACGFGALLITALVLPCPIDGFWVLSVITNSHGCDAHAFLRFADGKVRFYHDLAAPSESGTYRRMKDNTYEWVFSSREPPVVVHTGLFWGRFDGIDRDRGNAWGHRDLHFLDAERIVHDTENPPTPSPNKSLEPTADRSNAK
jgi:hypothetical protein